MSEKSFAGQVAESVLYSGAASVVARIANAGALFFTLKIITEAQLGIAALAIALFDSIKSLTELGLGEALVQAEKPEKIQVDSLFWMTFVVSAAFYIMLFFAAPLIAHFYETPELAEMVRVYMLAIVLYAIYMIPSKLLMKELEFKKLAITDNLTLLFSAMLMIYLAANGFGAWAIILAELANKFGQTVLCQYFLPYYPKFHYNYKKVKDLVAFGIYTTGSKFFKNFYMNADYLIIGKVFSKDMLGIYSFAYRIVFDTVKELSSVINRVAFPTFSKLRHEIPRLRIYFYTISRASMLTVGVLMIIIGTYADWMLELTGYQKWLDAVPYMRIFVMVGIFQCLITLLPKLLNAKGQAKLNFYYTAVNALILPLGFLIAAQFSMMAVALSWFIVYPAVSLVIIYFGAMLTESNPVWFTLKSFDALLILIPITIISIAFRYGVLYLFGSITWLGLVLPVLMLLVISFVIIWFKEQKTIEAIRR